ncbi:MAG: type II toxin-antitoxin system VapC family toxin [Thiohalospira sp.]
MALRYLLDTNVLSGLVRRPHGEVANRIAEVGGEAVCTSLVVAGELRFGAAKSGSEKLRAQVEAILGALEVLPLDPPVDQAYADIRHALECAGQPIDPNALWIAAHARSLDLTLVTGNLAEFQRVPRLAVENWLD